MSDTNTNTISLTYSKNLQPLIETAYKDFRQYLENKAQNELATEQAKIKAVKEKWDAALKALNRNGALDSILFQVANKFMGEPVVPPKINKPSSKYSEDSKSTKDSKEVSLISLITEFRSVMYTGDYNRASQFDLIFKVRIKNIYQVLKR